MIFSRICLALAAAGILLLPATSQTQSLGGNPGMIGAPGPNVMGAVPPAPVTPVSPGAPGTPATGPATFAPATEIGALGLLPDQVLTDLELTHEQLSKYGTAHLARVQMEGQSSQPHGGMERTLQGTQARRRFRSSRSRCHAPEGAHRNAGADGCRPGPLARVLGFPGCQAAREVRRVHARAARTPRQNSPARPLIRAGSGFTGSRITRSRGAGRRAS